jgi:hypothetical protein
VVVDEFRQVEVCEGVPGDDEERVVLEGLFGILHAARGTKGLLLPGVAQLHAELLTVPEVIAHEGCEELHSDHGLAESMTLQQPQYVIHDWAIGHGQQRLGHARGHGAKAGSFTAGHNDGLHIGNVLLGKTTVIPTSPIGEEPHIRTA